MFKADEVDIAIEPPHAGRNDVLERVQREERLWFVITDRDPYAERFDTTAGCEFVDDRIRLPE